ncbi:MAG TPA: hypothetical protein VNU26_16340 [Mycobacteriales bacterium]|nr:hypothetical protein [Mycobacteriales bacterium]
MTDRWSQRLAIPTTPPTAHLDDDRLLEQPSADEHKHLTDCGWCRARRESVTWHDASDGTDEEFEQALSHIAWGDDFRVAAGQAVVPARVRELMDARAETASPKPGQVWRLTWQGRHLLAAIIDTDAWHILIAPVTTDAELADEFTLRLDAEESPLETALAVWVRHRAAVPTFTLDRHIGTLPDVGAVTGAAQALHELVAAHRAGGAAPDGLPTGEPLTDEDVDALDLADAINDTVAWFENAAAGLRYLPEDDPAPSAAQISTAEAIGQLARTARGLSQLAARTNITPGRLLDLRRGAQPDADEYAALARVSDGTIGLQSPGDAAAWESALTAVSAPRWRRARQAWTAAHAPEVHPDDPSALVRHVTHNPMAARSVPHPDEPTDDERQTAYWRDQVALALHDFE